RIIFNAFFSERNRSPTFAPNETKNRVIFLVLFEFPPRRIHNGREWADRVLSRARRLRLTEEIEPMIEPRFVAPPFRSTDISRVRSLARITRTLARNQSCHPNYRFRPLFSNPNKGAYQRGSADLICFPRGTPHDNRKTA